MNRLNWLFTYYSIIALVIIIERLLPSPILPPFNFIRLHQFNQTVIFITATVVLSFFYLKLFTNDFLALKNRGYSFFMLIFLVGIYLYGAGEGWHEIASFTLNTYCNPKKILGNLCHGLFINDYYAGNIIFFVGSIFVTIVLLYLSSKFTSKKFNAQEMIVLVLNSLVYAFTWFAYAAFDVVLIGLMFSTLLMLISWAFLIKVKYKFRDYPFITYSTIAYTLSTLTTIFFKFR